MTDASTALLINILYATVMLVQKSPEIDQTSPNVKHLKRTLLEQILKLLATHEELQLTGKEMQTVGHGI